MGLVELRQKVNLTPFSRSVDCRSARGRERWGFLLFVRLGDKAHLD